MTPWRHSQIFDESFDNMTDSLTNNVDTDKRHLFDIDASKASGELRRTTTKSPSLILAARSFKDVRAPTRRNSAEHPEDQAELCESDHDKDSDSEETYNQEAKRVPMSRVNSWDNS